MPAKFVRRSAIPVPSFAVALFTVPTVVLSNDPTQHLMDPLRCRDALGRRIDDLGTTVGAVAAGEDSGVIRRPSKLPALALADRDNDHVARNGFAAARRPYLDARHGARS